MKKLVTAILVAALSACGVLPVEQVCQPGQTGFCKAVDEGYGGGDAGGAAE